MSGGSTLGLFEFATVSGGVGAHVTVGFVSVIVCAGVDIVSVLVFAKVAAV